MKNLINLSEFHVSRLDRYKGIIGVTNNTKILVPPLIPEKRPHGGCDMADEQKPKRKAKSESKPNRSKSKKTKKRR